MKISLYLALAVFFVYTIYTGTCATTAKPDPKFALIKGCFDDELAICKEEVETMLKAAISGYNEIVEKCGTAETKQCLKLFLEVGLPAKCKGLPDFLTKIRQETITELQLRPDGNEACDG